MVHTLVKMHAEGESCIFHGNINLNNITVQRELAEETEACTIQATLVNFSKAGCGPVRDSQFIYP